MQDNSYTIAFNIAPFVTYLDVQRILGDLIPITTERHINVLLGRKNNTLATFPTVAVLQSKSALEDIRAGLLDRSFFKVNCNVRRWTEDESVPYLSCAVNNMVNELTKDSIVLYCKRACPVELHQQLAQLLLDESDPQLIMNQYVTITINGTKQPSL